MKISGTQLRRIAGITGRFVLSLNDHPAVREIFSTFQIDGVRTFYSIAGGCKGKLVGEVVITSAARSGSDFVRDVSFAGRR